MGLKDLFSKKKNNSSLDVNEETVIGSNSNSKKKIFGNQKNKAFKDEDFRKEDDEIDFNTLNTLNTLNQTELNKNHISLKTDINDDLFATKFDSMDTLDDFNRREKEEQPKIEEIDEKELLALYEEEESGSKNKKEEDSRFKAQIEELNNLAYDGDFSSKKLKEEKLYRNEELEDPQLKAKIEELNEIYSENKSSVKENDDFMKSDLFENLDFENLQTKNDSFKSRVSEEDDDKKDSIKPEDFFKGEKELDDDLDLDSGRTRNDISTKSTNLDIDSLSSLDNDLYGKANKSKKSYRKVSKYKKGISFKSKLAIFGTTLVLGLGGIGTSLQLIYSSKEKEKEAIKSTFALYGQSKDINQHIKDALSGNKDSEKKLMSLLSKSSEGISVINNSIRDFNNQNINAELSSLDNSFKSLRKNIEVNKGLFEINKQNEVLGKQITSSIENMKTIVQSIHKSYQAAEKKANQSELDKVLSLEASLTKMNTYSNNILLGNNLEENTTELNNEKNTFKNNLLELAKGDEKQNIREILLFPEVVTDYNNLATEWKNILDSLDNVVKAKESIAKIISVNKENEVKLNQITKNFSNINAMLDGSADSKMNIYLYLLIAGIISVALSSVILIIGYKRDRKIQEDKLLQESEENKSSIMKLVNELVYLRDGDLTKRTTVDESITTDIADAINSTMDSLSAVVRKIQASSTLVNTKTNHINKLADNLLTSTEVQSNSIVEVSKSISDIAKDISAISEKTKLSLNTAKTSQNASMVGLETVKHSFESMNVINKNMDETVVLMKKVSDSSNQISEVISLLSDITEETNILALNATVQAAKAGEAGKGFKVVADAIQELADNAAEATRRVGALIATVQTDIQSVGLSIDKTTKEVQKGVQLSENVGKQLDQIASISNELADIIKSVSADTNTNAETAKKLTENMNNILKLTEKTKDSARDTTQAISEIEKVSSELSNSVQSFVVN